MSPGFQINVAAIFYVKANHTHRIARLNANPTVEELLAEHHDSSMPHAVNLSSCHHKRKSLITQSITSIHYNYTCRDWSHTITRISSCLSPTAPNLYMWRNSHKQFIRQSANKLLGHMHGQLENSTPPAPLEQWHSHVTLAELYRQLCKTRKCLYTRLAV